MVMCLGFLVLAGNKFRCFVHMVLIVQYSCAVVSEFGSGGKLVLVLHTYLLRVQYNCGVVLVFGPGGKQLLTLRTYLVYNTVVGFCQFFGCGGKSSQNENTFLQKNLIGLLYYDPIADVCIYMTKHSFTLYLSILDISLVPHRFAR